LAEATAILASRGQRFQPILVKSIHDPISNETTEQPHIQKDNLEGIDPRLWDTAIDSMAAVIYGERGTARAVGKGAPYRIAGKSGTAQVFSVPQDEEYDEEEIAERMRDHALFIAFAPIENPKIAVAVVVENGRSGSSVAGPIARRVIDAYLAESANTQASTGVVE